MVESEGDYSSEEEVEEDEEEEDEVSYLGNRGYTSYMVTMVTIGQLPWLQYDSYHGYHSLVLLIVASQPNKVPIKLYPMLLYDQLTHPDTSVSKGRQGPQLSILYTP